MILIAGGTGRLGTHVVNQLTQRGLEVRVLTRDTKRARHLGDRIQVAKGDVRDPRSLAPAFAGVDVVIAAVHGFAGSRGSSPVTVDRGGNANLTDAAKTAGAHLVLMSVVGAGADSPMVLFRMKQAAEQHAIASGVPTTIVRATAFAELWIDLLRQTAARSGRPLVFGRGNNPINFVSVADVAAVVERAVIDPASRGTTLEIGGPDNLTFNQLAEAVQLADGRTSHPRHLPPMMLRVLAATFGRLRPQLGRQTRAAIAMDSRDLTFNPAVIHRTYPDLPRTSIAQLLTAASHPSSPSNETSSAIQVDHLTTSGAALGPAPAPSAGPHRPPVVSPVHQTPAPPTRAPIHDRRSAPTGSGLSDGPPHCGAR